MKRLGITVLGIAAVAAAATFALRPDREAPSPEVPRAEAPAKDAPAKDVPAKGVPAKGAVSTLYCEFTNFADRSPLVGFYFTIEEDRPKPVYAQIFQREQDGTQDDFGGPSAPRPEWSYDDTQSPPVIHSPDNGMQINLYDYDPTKAGSTWFEAGLRSIRYRNLGGKCRRSQA